MWWVSIHQSNDFHHVSYEVYSSILISSFSHPLVSSPSSSVSSSAVVSGTMWTTASTSPQPITPTCSSGCDMESGGRGLYVGGCGPLVGLANLTSNCTGSINYNFCV